MLFGQWCMYLWVKRTKFKNVDRFNMYWWIIKRFGLKKKCPDYIFGSVACFQECMRQERKLPFYLDPLSAQHWFSDMMQGIGRKGVSGLALELCLWPWRQEKLRFIKLLGLDWGYIFYAEQWAHSTQLCRIKKSQPKGFFIHLELSCVSAFPNSQLPSRDEDFHGGPDLEET